MANIGILGGIFDPPHYGHIALAEKAVDSLYLNKIICVPSKVPPHKTGRSISAENDRLQMLAYAIEGKDFCEISNIEIVREGFSYTVDTLKILKGMHKKDILFFIIGADNIAEIENWHEPDKIISLVTVAAFTRPGFSQVGKFSAKIKYFEMDPVDISSSMIRDLVKEGRSIAGLTPNKVIEYIDIRGLYHA